MKYLYKKFQYLVVNSFIDSGAGLVSPIWFVALKSESNFIFTKQTIWVWFSYNEWTNPLCVYKYLFTNYLHGKEAELYLANS